MPVKSDIVSKVGRRGQITLPRAVRAELGLKEGDYIAFVRKDGSVALEPLKETLLNLRGAVPVSKPQDFETIRHKVLKSRFKRNSRLED